MFHQLSLHLRALAFFKVVFLHHEAQLSVFKFLAELVNLLPLLIKLLLHD